MSSSMLMKYTLTHTFTAYVFDSSNIPFHIRRETMALFIDLQSDGFTFDKTPVLALDSACSLMNARGDFTKKYVINNKLYTNGRTLIVNPSTVAQQPYLANNIVVTVVGKVDNYAALRADLASSYTFKYYHDAELVVNLYRKYGTPFVGQLRGQFALTLYDIAKNIIVAANDHAGVHGMFHAYSATGKISTFATERKALRQLAKDKSLTIERVLPASLFTKDIRFKHYNPAWMQDAPTFTADTEVARGAIRSALTAAVRTATDCNTEVGVLLSGGLDSALIASVLSRMKDSLGLAEIKTYSIGLETGDDMAAAEAVSDYLQTNHTGFILAPEDAVSSVDEVIYAVESYDVNTVRSSIVLYMLAKWIKEESPSCKVLLTGDGADDIFAGHSRYSSVTEAADLFQQLKTNLADKWSCSRTQACVAQSTMEMHAPFCERTLVDLVMLMDPQLKLQTQSRQAKQLLRDIMVDFLPAELVNKPKKSTSDILATTLSAHAETAVTDADFANRSMEFPNDTLDTKEALLYRRVFKTHFE